MMIDSLRPTILELEEKIKEFNLKININSI